MFALEKRVSTVPTLQSINSVCLFMKVVICSIRFDIFPKWGPTFCSDNRTNKGRPSKAHKKWMNTWTKFNQSVQKQHMTLGRKFNACSVAATNLSRIERQKVFRVDTASSRRVLCCGAVKTRFKAFWDIFLKHCMRICLLWKSVLAQSQRFKA